MRQLAICLFTLLIGLPAFVFGVVFAEADSAANQAKATACQAEAAACQTNATACESAAAACQAKWPRYKIGNVACADCPSDERIKHLQEGAKHLHAAGMEPEAKRALALAEALHHELLAHKNAEIKRLQAQIQQLQHAPIRQQQVILHVQIAEVCVAKLQELGLRLPGAAGTLFDRQKADGSDDVSSAAITLHHCDPEAVAEFNDAARKENILQVLAEPTLVSVTGRPFSYTCGGEIPTPHVNPDKSIQFNFKQVGTQIDGVANVLENGNIRLDIRARFATLNTDLGVEVDGVKVPGVRVRQVDTCCDVEPGKTVVIGGPLQRCFAASKIGRKIINERSDVQMFFAFTPQLVDALPPADESDSPEVYDAPKPVPAPTAQAPAATRK